MAHTEVRVDDPGVLEASGAVELRPTFGGALDLVLEVAGVTLGDDCSIESGATTNHGRVPDLRLSRVLSSLPLGDRPGATTGLPGNYADGSADGTCCHPQVWSSFQGRRHGALSA
ncbi:MAG: hypothetical protein ACYCV7_03735 [Acidimicrobiales bacterium]